ncbi:hypothetical protein ACFVH6_07925 [Spirillospora sp. NPDC127200]
MKEPLAGRARVLATVTRLVAVLLVPVAFCRAPGHARFLACQWALGLRFPAGDLRGLAPEARRRALPPEESGHVRGLALDVRPTEGARWLEQHGRRYRLYRVYDNDWWHFEYRTVAPVRLPHPAEDPGRRP